jgi:hypothetical protein
MNFRSGGTLFAVVLSMLPTLLSAQVTSSPPADAGTLLAGLAATFSNVQSIGSVQLNGTVQRYTGSTSDSGPVALTANADGSNQIRLELSEGTRTELQTAADASRSCQWSGSDGVMHDSSGSNCWTAVVWFLPQIALQPARPSPILGTNYEGMQSTAEGTFYVLENHLIVSPGKTPAAVTSQIQNQSATTLYLDATTLLPSVLDYTVLSDSGSTAISVEVRYSHYQRLSGLMIPGRIERYLDGSLELAIDVNQATILN